MRNLHYRPNLTTARLHLRQPCMADVEAIVGIVGQWEVARRLATVPHPYGPQDARFFLEQIFPKQWGWGITLTGSPELIGVVGLTPRHGKTVVGYWLSPAQWGKGIATEAAHAAVAFGFQELRQASIGSAYHEDNPASGRVLHKLGFVEVTRGLRPCLAEGRNVVSVEMRLNAADFIK